MTFSNLRGTDSQSQPSNLSSSATAKDLQFAERGEIKTMQILPSLHSGPPSALLKITPSVSFPRKRESIGLAMGPRVRGDDDADFHCLGWAKSPWELLRMTC
ncbi:hypothetical protein SBA2_800029 [Acidobacteriia bacterium SbA2]|nr:hypothetical protein SBA2_800029 [Acidobacteriia bacterium SbA2]